MRGFSITLLALGSAAVSACSAYSPNLPEEPFLCGDTPPQCPDGYSCVAQDGRNVCVSSSVGSNLPDASFLCADDGSLEPNNTIQTAYVTPVATSRTSIELGPLSICPSGDIDNYAATPNANGSTLTATVNFSDSTVPLTVEILDTSGDMIASGMTDATTVTAQVPDAQIQEYVIQVAGPATGGENNYTISISVTD